MADNNNLTLEKRADFEWWPLFLQALREMPNVSRAARKAGVSRQTAYAHRDEYVAFKINWEDAIKEGVERWEELAGERAFEGLVKPIMYEGKVVKEIKEFSDTLAIFLLKAHDPEKYRERSEIKSDVDLNIRIKFDEGE